MCGELLAKLDSNPQACDRRGSPQRSAGEGKAFPSQKNALGFVAILSALNSSRSFCKIFLEEFEFRKCEFLFFASLRNDFF